MAGGLNGKRSTCTVSVIRCLVRHGAEEETTVGEGAGDQLCIMSLEPQYDITVVERDRGAEIARRVKPADAA